MNFLEKIDLIDLLINSTDELYLFFILFVFFITIIFSQINNKFLLNFKLSLFVVYFSIFLNIAYTFFNLFFIYAITISHSLLQVIDISLLDLFYILLDSNYQNITDLLIKSILTLSISIWFIVYATIIKNKYTKKENTNYEIIILYLLTTYLLLKLISSTDMLMFVLTLESQNLALCIICAYTVFDKGVSKIEAALKLYITSAAGSGFLLLGCSILYGSTGTINFLDIATQLKSRFLEQVLYILENILSQIISSTDIEEELLIYYSTITLNEKISILLLIIGILCFFISIAFKIGQVPFHLWMADVYNGGNTLFVSYLAIFPKIAIGYFFSKSIIFYFNSNLLLLKLLFISGFLTIIIGILGALYQKKIKSFIAYSSIANLGYLILLSSAANIINSNILITISVIFITNYALIILQIFISLFSNIYIINHNNNTNTKEITYLNELSGYWKINKINSIFLIISFLALIGIPPILGFIIKFYIVTLLITNKLILVSWSFLILGVISTFYYLKIIKIIIFDNVNKNLYLIKNYILNKWTQINIVLMQCLLFLKPLILICVILIILL